MMAVLRRLATGPSTAGAHRQPGHRLTQPRAARDEGRGCRLSSRAGRSCPAYERPAGVHPPLDYPGYRRTALRHPTQPLVLLPQRLTEVTGPLLGEGRVGRGRRRPDHPARRRAASGERIIVTGRVLDGDGRPVPDTLVEIWQANAGGRYRHAGDQLAGAARPELRRAAAAASPTPRAATAFITIKPGAYPWKNHHNAWRPAHIHFSLFGRAFTQRLVTQMYFPGDPLFPPGPDLQLGPRRAGPAAADLPLRPRRHPSPSGRSASSSTSCCAAATRRRSRTRPR